MAAQGTDLLVVERGGTLHKATAAEVAALAPIPSGILPTGGTSGQVLAKTSATDFAAGWADPDSVGGSSSQAISWVI